MTLLEAACVAIVASGTYFVGRLFYMVIGGMLAVSRATARARQSFAREMAGLSTPEIRQRLLEDSYLTHELRNAAAVQALLSRIAQGDEVALASEYPTGKLYNLFARAEFAAGTEGRPRAVDTIDTISGLLQELARRTSSEVGGPTTG